MAKTIVSKSASPLTLQGNSHSVYDVITSRILAELDAWCRALATAVSVEAPGQSLFAEGVPRTQCPDARLSGIPLSLLADVESGESSRRAGASRGTQFARHLLERRGGAGVHVAERRDTYLEAFHPSLLQRL
jgi:hypothetical protein